MTSAAMSFFARIVPRSIEARRCLSRLRVLGLCVPLLACGMTSHAQQPPDQDKPLPIYAAKPGACYVLLRGQYPYVGSGNYPACRAVLNVLNESCNEPPQYDRRKFSADSKELRTPHWQPIDSPTNLDIAKWAIAPYRSEDYRNELWKQLAARASVADIRIYRAEVQSLNRDKAVIAFRVENLATSEGPGFNQPRLLFSEAGSPTASPLFNKLPGSAPHSSDLLRFGSRWFLFGFDPSQRMFILHELSQRNSGADFGMIARCSIQHVVDRQKGP